MSANVIGCIAATVVRAEDTETHVEGKLVVTVNNGVVLVSIGGQRHPIAHAALENDDVAELIHLLVEAMNANGGSAVIQVHELGGSTPS